jgi:hypothetical protein
LAALFETIEAVKLTFYIGLQNGFDVNCLTLRMRLFSHDHLIIRLFMVDKKL